jgi:phosphate/sulfate permease
MKICQEFVPACMQQGIASKEGKVKRKTFYFKIACSLFLIPLFVIPCSIILFLLSGVAFDKRKRWKPTRRPALPPTSPVENNLYYSVGILSI